MNVSNFEEYNNIARKVYKFHQTHKSEHIIIIKATTSRCTIYCLELLEGRNQLSGKKISVFIKINYFFLKYSAAFNRFVMVA